MIDIKKETTILIEKNINLSPDETQALFDIGLLQEHICKKILIRNEYFTKCSYKRKTELKILLAEKYCVSLATVEKIIVIK